MQVNLQGKLSSIACTGHGTLLARILHTIITHQNELIVHMSFMGPETLLLLHVRGPSQANWDQSSLEVPGSIIILISDRILYYALFHVR